MRGRVGGGDDDEQRDHGEDGQGGEAYGPLHELELLATLVEVLDAGLDGLRCSGSAAMTPGQLDQRHRVAGRLGQYLLPALAAWRARLLVE